MSQVEFTKSGSLFLFIGADRIQAGWLVGAHWTKGASVDLPIQVREESDPLTGLSNALARTRALLEVFWPTQAVPTLRPAQVRALVADCWLAQVSIPWNGTLMSTKGVEATSRAWLATTGAPMGPADRVVVDDAAYGHPRIAVAYPAAMLAILSAFASGTAAHLTSVLPLSIAAWKRAQRASPDESSAVAVLDRGLLVVVHGTARPASMAIRRLPEIPAHDESTASAISAQWRRMCVRDPLLTRVARLDVLNLSDLPLVQPAEASSPSWRIDDVSRREQVEEGVPAGVQLVSRMAGERLALDGITSRAPSGMVSRTLAAGVALLAVFATFQAWRAVEHTDAQRHAQQDALRRLPEAPKVPDWSRAELSRVTAVNTAISSLNLPVGPLLKAMIPTADLRVDVLEVDLQPTSARGGDSLSAIKVVAQARTGQEMARYVALLADRPPFLTAYLLRHEVVDSAPDRPYRFTVEATWRTKASL